MLILALDTSSSVCSVAVAADREVLAEQTHANAREQAKMLVPMINAALEEAGRGYDELDLLAVNIGPGSFTGLRIGLATVRGLSLALDDLPVMGITTFDLYADALAAARTIEPDEKILVAIESMRADLFFQLFNADLSPASKPFNCSVEDAAARPDIRDLDRSLIVTGDAREKMHDALFRAEYAPEDQLYESAGNIAQLAFARTEQGAKPEGMPAPLYLRPPDVTMPKKGAA